MPFNKYILQSIAILFFCTLELANIGCKKFVQIGTPVTQIATTGVFDNSGTATSAMLNIYEQMYQNDYSYNLEVETGLLGDELINYSTTSNTDYYTNSMLNSGTYGPWTNAYQYIYQANAIIEGLKGNSSINAAISQQLTGEALFIRAFFLFNLTNCYGDIPLPLTANYSTSASLPRTPKKNVYQQIVSDLKQAQTLLSTKYIDASDTTMTIDRIRPTTWAASALLARAYLYTGDYVDAEAQATTVINNTSLFSLVTSDLTKVFAANSAEAIWQLGIPMPNSFNSVEGYYFILRSVPTSTAISNYLMNAFEANDKRKANWIGTFTAGGVNYYFPFKYRSYSASPITEYTMVLRLAEQYLIRAEARIQEGNTNEALSDLNIIRSRAGLPNYGGATDQGSLLSAVLHERQVELFTEWGHRWFDMIRMGAINGIMGTPGNVCQAKGGTWNSNWQLFPIPQSEIINDPQLSQNNSYSN